MDSRQMRYMQAVLPVPATVEGDIIDKKQQIKELQKDILTFSERHFVMKAIYGTTLAASGLLAAAIPISAMAAGGGSLPGYFFVGFASSILASIGPLTVGLHYTYKKTRAMMQIADISSSIENELIRIKEEKLRTQMSNARFEDYELTEDEKNNISSEVKQKFEKAYDYNHTKEVTPAIHQQGLEKNSAEEYLKTIFKEATAQGIEFKFNANTQKVQIKNSDGDIISLTLKEFEETLRHESPSPKDEIAISISTNRYSSFSRAGQTPTSENLDYSYQSFNQP